MLLKMTAHLRGALVQLKRAGQERLCSSVCPVLSKLVLILMLFMLMSMLMLVMLILMWILLLLLLLLMLLMLMLTLLMLMSFFVDGHYV